MRVSLTPEAEADLTELEAYYGARGDLLGPRHFMDDLLQAAYALADFPERHPLRGDVGFDVRGFAFRGRVTVLYRIAPEEVRIVGFFGAGRRLTLKRDRP